MIKNTWDAANEYYRLLLSKDGERDRVAELEQQWLDGFNNHPLAEYFDQENIEQTYDTPLDAFRDYLAIGILPPTKVLLAMELCFDTYDLKDGAIEYEEVFHGARKGRRGNHSAQTFKNRVYSAFHEKIDWYSQSKYPAPAHANVAEKFLEQNPEIWPDVDSFLRGYYRWKNKQVT